MIALALAAAVAAVPPLPPFASELRPRDASTAPLNASLFALGNPAPIPESIGAAATVNGATTTLSAGQAIGCCVIRYDFVTAPPEGATVSVTLTSAGGDSTTTWTVGPVDDVAPTLTQAPTVIDHNTVDGAVVEEAMIIGVEVADDTQIGMITATLDDGTIAGATVDGYVLAASAPIIEGQACVDVTVVDVAGNESEPTEVCVTPTPAEGEGEGFNGGGGGSFGGGAECEGPGGMPINVPSTSSVLALLVVLAFARRR